MLRTFFFAWFFSLRVAKSQVPPFFLKPWVSVNIAPPPPNPFSAWHRCYCWCLFVDSLFDLTILRILFKYLLISLTPSFTLLLPPSPPVCLSLPLSFQLLSNPVSRWTICLGYTFWRADITCYVRFNWLKLLGWLRNIPLQSRFCTTAVRCSNSNVIVPK